MNDNLVDGQTLESLQRQDWNSVANGWKKWWRTIEDSTQVVADRIIELAHIQQGHKVLDIGTGIGEPAISVAKKVYPDGKVIGIDISEQMLAIAKERARAQDLDNITEFREADAGSLDLAPSSLDAIISRFGLMFLPDLPNTLRTMREALVTDGKIAAAVWSSPSKTPFLSLPFNIILKETGASPPPAGNVGPFSLADTEVLYDKFKQAGYQGINIEKNTVNYRFKSPEDFAAFIKEVAGPTRTMMAGQSTARQTEIWNAVIDAVRQQYSDPSTGIVNLLNEVIYIVAKK